MKSALKSFIFLVLASFVLIACKKNTADQLNPPIANAGNSQTIQLPAASFTLTGSGTTENGSIVGYLWSQVSGPNVPIIANAGSRIAVISNIVAGNYVFQFMVIDNAGLTGVDTVSILVNPAPIQTITLQPTNNPNEIHFAVIGSTNASDPNSPEFGATAWTSGGIPMTTRGAFRFDLSSIPSTATIISAKLTLFSNHTPLNGNHVDANFGTNNAMYIERIISNWSSATTWQNQPSTDVATQILIQHTNQSFLDLIDVDVKNMIATMISTNNYGFMIRLQSEVIYTSRIFCSSRYSDASRHPKLVVTYQ